MTSSPTDADGRSVELMIVFAAALAFYVLTLAPTVVGGDSASLALDALRGSYAIGTASDHPLFVVVGHLLTRLHADIAWTVNFESALFGALAVAMVYRCGRQLGAGRLAAGAGAAALAVSHAFWWHSVVAEVYTANAFFLAATLTLLLDWQRTRRWRYVAAAIATFVVGLTNHFVLAAVMPAAAVFVVAAHPRPFLTRGFLLGLAGVAAAVATTVFLVPPVTAVFWKVWVGPPSIWEFFRLSIKPGPEGRELGYYLAYLVYQFPSISLPLGVLGIWVLLRDNRAVAALLLLTVAANAGVFIHHWGWPSPGSTKFVFYISDYVVFSILCAVGTSDVLRRIARRPGRTALWGVAILAAVALVPPVVYASVPAAADRLGIDLIHGSAMPYRNTQRYFLNPNKHGEHSARRFATEAFQVAKPGAVIFADFTPWSVFHYLQAVEHVRPDVLIGSARTFNGMVPVHWIFDGAGQRRPTYLARMVPGAYDFGGLTGTYDLVPAGPMLELRPREAP